MAKYKLTQKTDANGTTQDIQLDSSCLDAVASIGGKNGAITLGSGLSISNSGELFTTGTGAKIVDLGTITLPYTLSDAQYNEINDNDNVIVKYTVSNATMYVKKLISFGDYIYFDKTNKNYNSNDGGLSYILPTIKKSTKKLTQEEQAIFFVGSGLSYDTSTESLSADLSNYVDLTSAQTISGQKTFTSKIFSKNSTYARGDAPTSNSWLAGVQFKDKNDADVGDITSGIGTNFNAVEIGVTDKDGVYKNVRITANGAAGATKSYDFKPASDNDISLGTASFRWKGVYIGGSGITSNGDIRANQSVPQFSGFMSGDEYNVSPTSTQSAQYLARDKNGNWMGGLRVYHTPPTRDSGGTITNADAEKSQTQLIARSPKTSTYSSCVMLEQDISATSNNQAGKCRFIPSNNGTVDLGAYSYRWRNLFTNGGIFDYGALSTRGVDASSNYAGYFLVAYTTHTSCYTQAIAEILAQDWDTMGGWYKFRVNGFFGFSNNVKVLNGQIGCTETGQGQYSAASFSSGHLYLVCRTTKTNANDGTNRLEIWYKADANYSRMNFYFKEDIGLPSRNDALTHWTKVKVAHATDKGYVAAGNIVYLDTAHDFPTFIPTSSWGVSAFQTTNYPTAEIKNNNLANDMKAWVGRFNSLTNYTNGYQYTLPNYTGTLGVIDKNTISATYIGNITSSVSLTSVITANGTYMLIPNGTASYGALYNNGSASIYFNHPLIVIYNGSSFSFSYTTTNVASVGSQSLPKANVTAYSCKVYKVA